MDKEKDIEIIVEVSKSDTVQKFNPFHDARGRFASSRGFKTYSANPNTKAGAMAIARSAAAGYGKTPNVHRQSGGNNIQQITNWLGQGKQANPRQRGYTTLRQRIEPVSGLAGAAATGAAWQAQNQKMGYTTTGSKRRFNQNSKQTSSTTQQTASKPSNPTQKPTSQKPQTTQAPKPTQQQNSANGSLNGFKGAVNGKNITLSFKHIKGNGPAVQQVADQQGYLGKPKLVSSPEFYAAAKKSGVIGFRTWSDGTDVTTGKRVSAKTFKNDLSNKDKISLNGSGAQAYGSGIYIATTSNPKAGKMPDSGKITSAVYDSLSYATRGKRATAAITLDPSARVGDGSAVSNSFYRQTSAMQAAFKHDIGAYAAALGYDALTWKNAGCGCDYTTVYNRTKLIVLDDPSNSAFGIQS